MAAVYWNLLFGALNGFQLLRLMASSEQGARGAGRVRKAEFYCPSGPR